MRWYRSTLKDWPFSRQAAKDLVHLSGDQYVRFRPASRIRIAGLEPVYGKRSQRLRLGARHNLVYYQLAAAARGTQVQVRLGRAPLLSALEARLAQ